MIFRTSSFSGRAHRSAQWSPSRTVSVTPRAQVTPRPKRENRSPVLTDSFGRFHNYLRISLTERCNLRCTYCMPEEGVPLQPGEKLLTTPEIIRLVKLFAEEGVDKVRFTGGEPTIRKDIIELVEGVGQIPGIKTIAMTTNGVVLAKKLPKLIAAGLNLINISLDTLDPIKFTEVTRRLGFESVVTSINHAVAQGLKPVKINCVVMRGFNENELYKFVEWTRKEPVQVRFIEYMPFEGNTWGDNTFMPYTEMIEKIAEAGYHLVRQGDGPNETSKTYKVEGFVGSVGFITSMSEHFCATCNRLRLMADGSLKVCLFGRNEVSLRDLMREGCDDNQLRVHIQAAVGRKKFSHDGMYEIEKNKALNRPMVLIGG